MTHLRARVFVVVLMAACASAGTDPSSTDPDPDPGTTGSGSNGSGSDTDPDVGVQPTYPMQHPRIYLGTRAADLKAALDAGTPAATRYRNVIDNWIGGADYWGMTAWTAALLTPLTGDPKYCTKAI